MGAPGLRMPRIAMHRCSASMTTITPRGFRTSCQRVGDLAGQPLLHLRPAGVDLDQPGQLGQPGDPAVLARDVADVRHAVEGHQVVLAGRVHRDVLDQHQLVVVLVEGGRQDLGRVLPEPGEGLGVGPGHPGGGVPQPVAVRVLPDRDQQLADGAAARSRLVDSAAADRARPARGASLIAVRGSDVADRVAPSWPLQRAAVLRGRPRPG